MLYLITFGPPLLIVALFIYKRSKYKNRKNAGAFFFENDCLVLNTGIPYAIPLDEIEQVELQYSPWELEHMFSYTLNIKVIRKDGRSKWVFYKGYRTANLRLPSDMKTALEEQGIVCVMKEQTGLFAKNKEKGS